MIEFTHAIYTITTLSLSGRKQHNTAGTMVKPIKGKDINRKKRNLLKTAPLVIQENIPECVRLISPALYITATWSNSWIRYVLINRINYNKTSEKFQTPYIDESITSTT